MSRLAEIYMRPAVWIDEHVEGRYWAQVLSTLYVLWPWLLFCLGLVAWGLMH